MLALLLKGILLRFSTDNGGKSEDCICFKMLAYFSEENHI
nr:hypothetical protein Iba_chr01aCG3410 [Ipomoea batatas]GMD13329.1 hypothetical protein Iba_chr07aCG11910 [Ipomoea batatas]